MRLIDADALLETIQGKRMFVFCSPQEAYMEGYTIKSILAMEKLVKEAPTIERPRGEWIVQDEGRTLFTCSYCKGINHKSHEKFCSDCGADMRGEGE